MNWRAIPLVFVGLALASCSDDPTVIFFGDIPTSGDSVGDVSPDVSADPFGPGAFSQEVGVCTSVEVAGRVTITLIHEGGRESAARSFTL